MAEEYKAVLVFEDADGKNITLSYRYAKPRYNAAPVVTMMDAFITNGSIFSRVPVKKKSFTVVKTENTSYAVESSEG